MQPESVPGSRAGAPGTDQEAAGTATRPGRCHRLRDGLTYYHYDYHDARGHDDRRIAQRVRRGEFPTGPGWEAVWIQATPEEMADRVIADFPDRFQWVQDDLRALVSPRPILAEGWGLRPELVAPVAGSIGRMVAMVATEEFRQRQVARLPRADAVGHQVSDPQLAQRNRVERDRLIAAEWPSTSRRSCPSTLERITHLPQSARPGECTTGQQLHLGDAHLQSGALEAAARTRTRTSSGPGRAGSNSASRITSGPPWRSYWRRFTRRIRSRSRWRSSSTAVPWSRR